MTSLFGGGSSINVNASGTLVPQQFTPTDGQTLFTLTSFTYTPNTNSLLVFINGTLQVPVSDYVETSSSSFTLTSPVTATDSVRVIGFPLASFFQAGVGNLPTDIPTVAIVQDGLYSWMGLVTGTANALVGSTTPAELNPTAGQVVRFLAAFANTGPVTLNGIAVTKNGAVALSAGDITVGAAYQAVYDGTRYQLSGGVGGSGGTISIASATITADTTIPSGSNGTSGGPVTIANGVTVTLADNSVWSIS